MILDLVIIPTMLTFLGQVGPSVLENKLETEIMTKENLSLVQDNTKHQASFTIVKEVLQDEASLKIESLQFQDQEYITMNINSLKEYIKVKEELYRKALNGITITMAQMLVLANTIVTNQPLINRESNLDWPNPNRSPLQSLGQDSIQQIYITNLTLLQENPQSQLR